jgi:hypothetical protein
MSETNDNLLGAASAETTELDEQAEGAESSGNESTGAASNETTAKKWAGKFDSPEALEKAFLNAEKLIGKKTIDPSEATKVLGLSNDSKPEQTSVLPETKAEGREFAQQVGGDALAQWFEEHSGKLGTGRAISILMQHVASEVAKTTIQQTLAPVNDQLNRGRNEQHRLMLESATDKLAQEYDDFMELAPEVGKFLETHPTMKKQIIEADSRNEKAELLESVYLRVARTKQKNSSVAAKTAGAVEAKQREEMKATAVTEGSGARSKAGDKTPEDDWLERVSRHASGGGIWKK